MIGTTRAKLSAARLHPSGATRAYTPDTPDNTTGNTNANKPTPNSKTPKNANGLLVRSATLPNSQLPNASPPMKLAITVDAAYTVFPNTSDNCRIHTTS